MYDAPRRPSYQDDRGVWQRFIDEEEAAEFECRHEWRMLGGLSGFSACVKCGQAMYMTMEFEYLTWTREVLEGHV